MVELSAYTHIGIRVSNRERSVKFYGNLGFHPVFEAEEGKVIILKNKHGIEINLIVNATVDNHQNILMDVPEKHPGITHAAFRISSVDQTLEALKQAGIDVSEGPVHLGPSVTAIFIRDPDRNVLELDYVRTETGR